MFKKILNIGIASVLLLAGCSSKATASPASVAENVKTEAKSTSGEKTEKKSDAVEKENQSSGAETKNEEKKTGKKAEAKIEASEKTDTKKGAFSAGKPTKKTQPSKSSGSASGNSGSSSSSASTSSVPQTQPQHVHSWEWVPAKTHTEPVVVQEGYDIIVCNGCGRQFRDPEEFSAHYDPDVDVTCGAYHIDTVQPVTEQREVVDSEGYYKCSCGATKEGW